jgi:L-ribulose-5-phosphate 4-epimerase
MKFLQLRQEVYWANINLPKAGLVTMHSGNASGIDRDSGIILIKPSGIDYETLRPEDLVALKLNGEMATTDEIPDGISSPLKPSVDAIHHLGLYREYASIGGVVHTHSNYATAWAVHQSPIPCSLTAMADEFGGSIPCAPYVDNDGENILKAIIIHRTKSPAILLGHHGVFTFDSTPKKAFKAAVMTEDCAKTLLLAMHLGKVVPLPEVEIVKWWNRYHTAYGQVGY